MHCQHCRGSRSPCFNTHFPISSSSSSTSRGGSRQQHVAANQQNKLTSTSGLVHHTSLAPPAASARQNMHKVTVGNASSALVAGYEPDTANGGAITIKCDTLGSGQWGDQTGANCKGAHCLQRACHRLTAVGCTRAAAAHAPGISLGVSTCMLCHTAAAGVPSCATFLHQKHCAQHTSLQACCVAAIAMGETASVLMMSSCAKKSHVFAALRHKRRTDRCCSDVQLDEPVKNHYVAQLLSLPALPMVISYAATTCSTLPGTPPNALDFTAGTPATCQTNTAGAVCTASECVHCTLQDTVAHSGSAAEHMNASRSTCCQHVVSRTCSCLQPGDVTACSWLGC